MIVEYSVRLYCETKCWRSGRVFEIDQKNNDLPNFRKAKRTYFAQNIFKKQLPLILQNNICQTL